MGKVASRAIRDQRSEKWHTHAHTTSRPPRGLRATHPLHAGSWRHTATAQGGSCCHRATGQWAPATHRRELLPPGGSASMELEQLEHAGHGPGNAHIEVEARGVYRGSRLGPDCTGDKTGNDATGPGPGHGDKTRGPELRLRPARTGHAASTVQVGVRHRAPTGHGVSWRHRATAQGGSCCHRAPGTCSDRAAAQGWSRELAPQGNRAGWELLPPGTGHMQRTGGSCYHRAAAQEWSWSTQGLGSARPTSRTRRGAAGLGLTALATRREGLSLGFALRVRGMRRQANRLGDDSTRIGDATRGLWHVPGPARSGGKRRGLGLGFALALLVLRARRRSSCACVLPSGPLARPSEQVMTLRCTTCTKS